MWRFLMLAPMLFMTVSAHAELRVVYPNVEGAADQNYGAQVLALALAKSRVPYTLTIHPARVNQERARMMIEEGQISVYDFGTSAEFEQRLLPVYFPIDRGFLGYRLFVIHRDNTDAFASITSIEQLREKTAGQGVNWSDTAILRHAGITVHVAPWESSHSHEILTPRRHTPPPQAVSSSVAVSDGLPCCPSLGWTLSDYARRCTVTS